MVMDIFRSATTDVAAGARERRSLMQHLSGPMTWSEGVAALLTLGINTFSLLV